jgi:protein phosphatase
MRIGLTGQDTHAGQRRRRNEDNKVVEPPLFAVADGMGGAQAGDLASQLAVEGLSRDGPRGAAPQERVVTLIQEANRRVWERASSDEAVSGMGTTLTVALVDEGVVWIGHVGDSRAYLLRGGRIEQLTDDHSLVAELVRSGRLSAEEAETHPQRSVITRALGTEPDVDVDSFPVEAQPGDVFMICSDGLTTMVTDVAIARIVGDNRGNLQAAAEALVKAANRRGGEDNITVVLFELAADGGEDGTTAAYPALDVPAADDEDTLDELDRVPAVDTMVVPVERIDEWERTRQQAALPTNGAGVPHAPRRRRRRLVWVGVAVALVIVAAALVVWGLSRAHFVGAEPDGRIAVYQGVPYDVTGSIRLYRAVYVSDRLRALHLSEAERRALFDHDLVERATALAAVRAYEQDVMP